MRYLRLLHANGLFKIANCLFLALPALAAAHVQARLDISGFGIVSLGAGEDLRLTAEATLGGLGCKGQLTFLSSTGAAVRRSLNINLAPGTSAFNDFQTPGNLAGIVPVKAAMWIDSTSTQRDCKLSLKADGPDGIVRRTIQIPEDCRPGGCGGETVGALRSSRLRIYVVATEGHRCRAQMGFKLPGDSTSTSARYVNLMSNHGDALEWVPGEDETLTPADHVIPVVAFHNGDSCLASAEVLRGTTSDSFSSVPVQLYTSSSVGLALDPASLPATVNKLVAELSRNPNDLWAIDSLAQAYNREGQKERAVNLLTNAVSANPKAAETWYLFAKIQFGKQDFNGALQSLKTYLTLRPGDTRGLSALGATFAKLHRFDESKQTLEPLLANRSTRTASALNSWAEMLSTQDRYSEALPFVEESDALHPNCKLTLYLKANILFGMGRIPESSATAERVVQLDPEFGLARLLLSKLYVKEGRVQEAQQQTEWLRTNFEKAR
jgi:tetratricopeptide (TPR) repeat protein